MEREKLAERIEFLIGTKNERDVKQFIKEVNKKEDNDPFGELQEAFCN